MRQLCAQQQQERRGLARPPYLTERASERLPACPGTVWGLPHRLLRLSPRQLHPSASPPSSSQPRHPQRPGAARRGLAGGGLVGALANAVPGGGEKRRARRAEIRRGESDRPARPQPGAWKAPQRLGLLAAFSPTPRVASAVAPFPGTPLFPGARVVQSGGEQEALNLQDLNGIFPGGGGGGL